MISNIHDQRHAAIKANNRIHYELPQFQEMREMDHCFDEKSIYNTLQ